MTRFIDITGQRFERLVALSVSARAARTGGVFWVCACDCGNTTIVASTKLRNSHTRSCGCLHKENCTKVGLESAQHGHCRRINGRVVLTKTYCAWASMNQRCNNPRHRAYESYGGRGILICVRWAAFENFLADMGECPPGCSLERVDNDGPYSPENCRWATQHDQARNKRNNRRITHKGETMILQDWADRIGITAEALAGRLRKWPLSVALETAPYPEHERSPTTGTFLKSRRNLGI